MIKNTLYICLIITISACVKNTEIDNKNFAEESTQDINKIIMEDKSGQSITLEKIDGNRWIVNQKYPAWKDQIEYTLKVMEDIRVKSSVSESAYNTVMKNLATTAVKIEIYKEDELTKTYYIGGNTNDHLGTYMIMKNSHTPFIMHIPDRRPGILNPKFGLEGNNVNKNVWRERIKISINAEDIQDIESNNLIDPLESFKLEAKTKTVYNKNHKKTYYNSETYKEFINSFSELKCGGYSNISRKNIKKIKIIKISTNEKRTYELKIYEKIKKKRNQNEFNPNVEIYYATWNNSDLVIIQKNIFNKVLINLSEIKI